MRVRKMKRRRRGTALVLGVALLTLVAPTTATATPAEKAQLFTFDAGDAVTGGFTLLQRWSDRAVAEARTTVEAGHAITLWWVAFNNPDACSDSECGEDDIFTFDADGNMTGFNVPQIQAADVSVFGSGGAVANPAGRLKLSGEIAEGDVPGSGLLVIGREDDGALVGVSDVSGLTDAQGAEIHFVLQDHGPAHEDPDLLNEQLTKFQGACNDVCVDIQFSVHKP